MSHQHETVAREVTLMPLCVEGEQHKHPSGIPGGDEHDDRGRPESDGVRDESAANRKLEHWVGSDKNLRPFFISFCNLLQKGNSGIVCVGGGGGYYTRLLGKIERTLNHQICILFLHVDMSNPFHFL